MKKLAVFLSTLLCCNFAFADHITGGEMSYRYMGIENGEFRYYVTLKLFQRCNSGRQFNNPLIVSVFRKSLFNRVVDMNIPLSRTETLRLENPDECITNPPTVCYLVGYYEFEIKVPPSNQGYLIVAQVIYRIQNITNFVPSYNSIGATYTGEIPSAGISTAAVNSSAEFTGNDLVIVCARNSFTYDFGAHDPDGDKLRYYFCNAYQGGLGFGNNASPPESPPYQSVPYGNGFSGTNPLGGDVKIDPETGIITGVAPATGTYVVTVCVEEVRNNHIIAVQRKDLQINIAECQVAAATIPSKYMLCGNEMSATFTNLSISPQLVSFNWECTDNKGSVIFSSTAPSVSHTFRDTGTYKVRLVTNIGHECPDSASADVFVYPGFEPDFRATGVCVSRPTTFADNSRTRYGRVNGWHWTFGYSGDEDESTAQNPSFTFGQMGRHSVQYIATNSNGCVDTVTKSIDIVDKPPLEMLFRDTMICKNDQLQLHAGAPGNYVWSPAAGMTNSTSNNPIVQPLQSTTYFAELSIGGCTNRDSVKVTVVDHVDLQAMNDTIVCTGDPLQLRINTNAFHVRWEPAIQFSDPTSLLPTVRPPSDTRYTISSYIGGCSASEEINVRTLPYPYLYAGADTTICYGSPAFLRAETTASEYSWRASAGIENTALLQQQVRPPSTVAYILRGSSTVGCPKPIEDTVHITVLEEIKAFAGKDTAVIIGQPLQLRASGGKFYQWTPSIGLNRTDIENPLALYGPETEQVRYRVVMSNDAGCFDSAFVIVKVYKMIPKVVVPNAFTPNGDGKNDLLRIVAAGIQRIEYFSLYNRWGQLVYRTSSNESAWDGTLNGKPLDSGVFVWIVKATDYLGATYMSKGTVTLIR